MSISSDNRLEKEWNPNAWAWAKNDVKKNKKNIVIEYACDYCSHSSLHGIAYLGARNITLLEKIWWLTIFLSSLSFCFYLISAMWVKWQQNPVMLSFEKETTPIWMIPFPAVTVCPNNKVRQRTYNYTEVFAKRNSLTGDEYKKFWDVSLVCNLDKYRAALEFNCSINISDKMAVQNILEVAPRILDTIYAAVWQGKDDKEMFVDLVNKEGVCYTFNALSHDDMFTSELDSDGIYMNHQIKKTNWSMENGYTMHLKTDDYPRRTAQNGPESGLRLMFTEYVPDTDYLCGYPISGYKIILHNPGEAAKAAQQYFLVDSNKETSIMIKPELITTSHSLKHLSASTRKCYFSSEKSLKFFKMYTQNNCRMECFANVTKNYCGCVPFYLPRDAGTLICGFKKLKCLKIIEDAGSDSNYIRKDICNLLKIPITKESPTTILGINNTVSKVSLMATATISSLHTDFERELNFLVVNDITQNVPSLRININYNYPDHVKLADPNYGVPQKVDALIGAEIFYELLLYGKIYLGKDKPILQNSLLGWLATGKINILNNTQNNTTCLFTTKSEQYDGLHEIVERFWNLDEFPHRNTYENYNADETQCELDFAKNTKRDDNGRYTVNLPFNENKELLGDSFQNALTRFYNLEKRLQRDTKLQDDYVTFMREYEDLSHMRKVDEVNEKQLDKYELKNNGYYIPHHAVLKATSSTTSLRVVYDASAVTSSNYSLNNSLRVGPVVQSELFHILIRFRKYYIVLTADVEKMFRQVLVTPKHRDFQRILWRENSSESVSIYELKTVTYGTGPATYLTTRCIKDLASHFETIYPSAASAIINDTYVDDIITGCNTEHEAIILRKQLTEIFDSGCFHLRKWCSNSTEVLNDCLSNDTTEKHLVKDSNDNRTLGVLWDSTKDTLKFTGNLDTEAKTVTKRTILSIASRVFDPLGILAPISIASKILLQRLWLLRLNWDDEVPDDIKQSWLNLMKQFKQINNVEIRRSILCTEPNNIQIFTFCDASESAYGAAIYLKSTNVSEEIYISLLCAKTRVAPTKRITLPRLELSGALLAAKLTKTIVECIHLPISKITYFTDSTIVLNWLNNEPCVWKNFVANRVTEIQKLTDISNWKHVKGSENPADLLTRGSTVSQLLNSNWLTGPEFLKNHESTWPCNYVINANEKLEKRKVKTTLTTTQVDNIANKYSSLTKLQRVLAYCLRFVNNLKLKKQGAKPNNDLLTVEETVNALDILIKIAQKEEFSNEINILSQGKQLPKSSKIVNLDPFLDENTILRVGGRLSKSELDYNKKHPILLPRGHNLTRLIIRYEHFRHLHVGTEGTLAVIRGNYWPINGKESVKKIIRNCLVCAKYAPKFPNIKMANFPRNRVTPSKPFTITALDMAGPILVKETKFRNKKVLKIYACIFVCFCSKAVHIELVSDLTCEGFLNCLKRFVARRGLPAELYSDNGRNFVAADKELQNAYKTILELSKNEIINSYFLANRIQWRFMPPRSPHFGGLHEAAVKSMKRHLKKSISNHVLTFENLHTVICEIEAILNSRPLCPISTDPNDLSVLTPGHLLIGHAVTAVPERNVPEIATNRLSQFQLRQHIIQSYWRQWSREYLSTLQRRSKWTTDSQLQPKIRDLVLISEDNVPPALWPTGRVAELYSGSDGRCRVASVKCKSGVYKRAIKKLCVLPIESEVQDDNEM